MIIGTKGKGGSVGEIGYVTGGVRNATVTAQTVVQSLRISYHDLKMAQQAFPQVPLEDLLWFESAKKVALGLLQQAESSGERNNNTWSHVSEALDDWRLFLPTDFDLTRPDLPPRFIMPYGSMDIRDLAGHVTQISAPALVESPHASSSVSFSALTRIMISKDEYKALVKRHVSKQAKATDVFDFTKSRWRARGGGASASDEQPSIVQRTARRYSSFQATRPFGIQRPAEK